MPCHFDDNPLSMSLPPHISSITYPPTDCILEILRIKGFKYLNKRPSKENGLFSQCVYKINYNNLM